jgi:two-component system sensor histidine kinase KdpD
MRVAVRGVRTRARGRGHNVASILPWGAMPESLPLPVARAGADIAGYALAVAGAAAAVIVAALAEHWVGLDDLSLVFMLAVLGVASRTHTGPAVATAVLCFLAYNFFFIEPRYTFYISAHHGVATVALFLAAAVLAGRLASRLAMQVQALSIAGRHASARQQLAQQLTVAATETDVVDAAHAVFRDSLGAEVWIRLEGRGLHANGVEPPSQTVLRRVADERQAETVEEFGWWFLPLRAPQQQVLGVIGLKLPPANDALDEGQRQLARTMAEDIAQALQRTRLVADLQAERLASETERLRSALLSSVSHDLRTPLAGIIGAAESLESYGAAMDEADRRSLLDTVREEGQRLDRYIQNLLDMTRLGQGGLTLQRDWIGVDELVGSAIARMQRYRTHAHFRVDVAEGIGPIRVHPALVEQALFNVIDNAAKFSPPDAVVAIAARRIAGESMKIDALQIDISDRGPGIPEEERSRIFEMFYSAGRGDRGRSGTGLGLAICRGMIEAHGGEVEVLAGSDGVGTTMRITLPLQESPMDTDDE